MKKLAITIIVTATILLNSGVLFLPTLVLAQDTGLPTPPVTAGDNARTGADTADPGFVPATTRDQSQTDTSPDPATIAREQQRLQQQTPSAKSDLDLMNIKVCSGGLLGISNFLSTRCFGWIFMAIGNRILWIAGIFLNFSIDTSIVDMSKTLKDLGAVNAAWAVFRDLANLFFIFILIYIAIKTILGAASGETRKMLTNVIIVALLINFSMFATKVVIDASNIVTVQFYNSISKGPSDSDNGLSQVFMNGSHFTNLFKNVTEKQLNETNFLLIGFLSLIFAIVLAICFVAIGILFLIRFVVLILLIILSPLAFLGYALPPLKSSWDEWWKTLTNQAIFAPFMMAMLWVTAAIINNPQFMEALKVSGADEATWSQALSGGASGGTAIPIIVNFAILIILLIAGMAVSKRFAGSTGTAVLGMADKYSRKAVGGMTLGLGARLGRQTAGRGFNAIAESKTAQRMAASSNIFARVAGMGVVKGSRAVAGSSFDARAMGVGGLGDAGGKGGYSKGLLDSQKAQKEFDKSLKANIYVDRETENAVKGHEETVETKRREVANLQKEVAEAKKSGNGTEILDAKIVQAIRDRDEATKKIKDINDDRSLTTTSERARAQNTDTIFNRLLSVSNKKVRADVEKDYEKGDTAWADKRESGTLKERLITLDAELEASKTASSDIANKITETQEKINDNLTKLRQIEEERSLRSGDTSSLVREKERIKQENSKHAELIMALKNSQGQKPRTPLQINIEKSQINTRLGEIEGRKGKEKLQKTLADILSDEKDKTPKPAEPVAPTEPTKPTT